MNVTTEFENDLTLVAIHGKLEMPVAGELRSLLKDLLESDHSHILIDMCGITFIDSACLGILVVLCKLAHQKGGVIRFANPNTYLRRTFLATGLINYLEVFDSVEAGASSFAAPERKGRFSGNDIPSSRKQV